MSGRNSNGRADAASNQIPAVRRLSTLEVLKYNLRGVPISLKHLPYEWTAVVPGAFPLAYPFLAALMAAPIGGFGFLYSASPSYAGMTVGDFFTQSWSLFAQAFLLQVLFNSVFFCYCALVLYVWNRLTSGGADCTRGPQRVVYFSSLWLSVMAFAVALYWAEYFGAALPDALMYPLILAVFPVAVVLRVLSIFQGVRRETQGSSLAAGLSVVGALDIWLSARFLVRVLWDFAAWG